MYDPYYCDGSVKQRLKDLGFPNVIHENHRIIESVVVSLLYIFVCVCVLWVFYDGRSLCFWYDVRREKR